MTEEIMTVQNTDICPCGRTFRNFDADDYGTLGADGYICCPDCGNEEFQTVATLQAQLEELRWRPVEEEPETKFDVEGSFLVVVNGVRRLATYAFSDKTWASASHGIIFYPTLWMRTPPLPEKGNENG